MIRFRHWLSNLLFDISLLIRPLHDPGTGPSGQPLCRWHRCKIQVSELWRRKMGYCAKHTEEAYFKGLWHLDDLPSLKRVQAKEYGWYGLHFIPKKDFA